MAMPHAFFEDWSGQLEWWHFHTFLSTKPEVHAFSVALTGAYRATPAVRGSNSRLLFLVARAGAYRATPAVSDSNSRLLYFVIYPLSSL